MQASFPSTPDIPLEPLARSWRGTNEIAFNGGFCNVDDPALPELTTTPRQEQTLVVQNPFDFCELERSWGGLTLPQGYKSKHQVVEKSPELALLDGYSTYWLSRGARALSPANLFDSQYKAALIDGLTTEVRSLVSNLKLRKDDPQRPFVMTFPEFSRDFALPATRNSSKESSGKGLDARAYWDEREINERRFSPVQFALDSRDGHTRAYSILAKMRNLSGDAVAFFPKFLTSIADADRHDADGVIIRDPYRPFIVTEFRCPMDLDFQLAGPARINILYSPVAFEIAREALLTQGLSKNANDPHRHLTESILHALVSRIQLGVDRNDTGYRNLELGGLPLVIESIGPLRKKEEWTVPQEVNDLLVECSCGDKKLTFTTSLHIWFPGELQRSNPYGQNAKDESPYTIRCSSELFDPKIIN